MRTYTAKYIKRTEEENKSKSIISYKLIVRETLLTKNYTTDDVRLVEIWSSQTNKSIEDIITD